MKNLIKLIIVVLLLSFGTDSFAQNFGIKAGLNLSNLLVKDDDGTLSNDYKMNPGFHMGPTVEFPINEMFTFESGLLLSTKGFKVIEEFSFLGYLVVKKSKMNLFYLDIPLTIKTSFDLGTEKIYGFFGPYIGIGLSGKIKTKTTFIGRPENTKEDIKWGSDENENDLKRLDFGLTMGAGLEISSIQIGFTYGLGLANISPYTDDGTMINHRVLGLSVGYKFDGK